MDKFSSLRDVSFQALCTVLGIDFAKYKTRKGGDEWFGACPVHGPKQNTTSFSYHRNGKWNCFSCGAKGRGGIDLCKAVRNCGFDEAVALLTPLSSQAAQTPATGASSAPQSVVEATETELKPFTGKYAKFFQPNEWLERRADEGLTRG